MKTIMLIVAPIVLGAIISLPAIIKIARTKHRIRKMLCENMKELKEKSRKDQEEIKKLFQQ